MLDSCGFSRGAVLLALLALTASVGATSCGGDDDDEQTLRAGHAFAIDTSRLGDSLAVQHAAEQIGYAAEQVDTEGPPNAIAALDKGDLDMASITYTAAAAAASEGAPIRVILGASMALDHLLVGNADIDDASQLSGRRVGFFGPGSELWTRLALDQAGVEEDAILVEVPDSPNRARAVAAGRLYAADIQYIDMQLLRSRGTEVSLLADALDSAPHPLQTAWVVREDFARENGELLQRIVDAMLVAYERLYTPAGKEQWLMESAAEFSEYDTALREDAYRRYRRVGQWPRADRPFTATDHDRLVELFVEHGTLEEPIAFEDLWEIRFWREADGD